jgi:hypothetical protein
MFLLIDAFGLLLAIALAFAVWGPDMYRWIAHHLGIRPPAERGHGHFGLD